MHGHANGRGRRNDRDLSIAPEWPVAPAQASKLPEGKTYPVMYQQVFDPVLHSMGWSAAAAALPLAAMFLLLGGLRYGPALSGLVAFVLTVGVAVAIYGMPATVAANVFLYSAAFTPLAIMWIPTNAIWIHNLMVRSGTFETVRLSFGRVSTDLRVQAILIAFCFGSLMEALSGGGTPVAVAAAMLMALGLDPIKAAVVALVADTAPVAFGGLAVPIVTLAQVTGLPFSELGMIVGRQTPLVGLFVPFILIFLVDGRRGLREAWLPAIAAGASFGLAQFLCSNFFSVALADVVAALAAAATVLAIAPFWEGRQIAMPAISLGAAAVEQRGRRAPDPERRSTLRAFAPYIVIIAVFALAQVGAVQAFLSHGTFAFLWPGLVVTTPDGRPVAARLNLNFLSATGTLLLFAGVLSVLLLRVSARTAVSSYLETLVQLRWMYVTVLLVLGVAFVMNYSGQTVTLGRFLAGAGHEFAFISPAVGWLGVAITGSDNSANALFGALQTAAAEQAGLPPALLAAANSAGGVMGKPISPQSLAIAAAAVGVIGREGDIFRACVSWTLLLLAGMCVLTYLQATPLLGWMLP